MAFESEPSGDYYCAIGAIRRLLRHRPLPPHDIRLPALSPPYVTEWSVAAGIIVHSFLMKAMHDSLFQNYSLFIGPRSPKIMVGFIDSIWSCRLCKFFVSISSICPCESVSKSLPFSDFHCTVSVSLEFRVWTITDCLQTMGCHILSESYDQQLSALVFRVINFGWGEEGGLDKEGRTKSD